MKTTCLALLALLLVGLAACGDETAGASGPVASARAAVNHYTSVVNEGSKRLDQSMSPTANCGKGDVATCRTEQLAVVIEAERYLRDLDKNPPPSCLKAVDVELRAALKDYRDGAVMVAQGIDANDAILILHGNDKTRSGTVHMNRVADLIRKANC